MMITPMTEQEFNDGIPEFKETHVQRLQRFIGGLPIDSTTKAQLSDFRRNIVMSCMLNHDIDKESAAALYLCDLYMEQIEDDLT